MTEAETLRAAAAKLRELAAANICTSPWRVDWHGDVVGADGDDIVTSYEPILYETGTADWIAALSPAIAEPLAAWLDDEASTFEEYPYSDDSPNPLGLAVARAILGGES